MMIAFDVMFFFDASNHISADIMPLLIQMRMQTIYAVTLLSFTVSGSN